MPVDAQEELRVVAMMRESEQYVLVYDAESRAEALRQVCRWAVDLELEFSWYDAAVMSRRMMI